MTANTTERHIHRACLEYLRLTLPGAVLHHSPNEQALSGADRAAAARVTARLKGMGMLPGFPDILVLWQGRAWGIEVKGPKGLQSPSQKAVQAAFEAQRIPYHVVRSLGELQAAMGEALGGAEVVSVPLRGVVS